jgi:hypothetical protein
VALLQEGLQCSSQAAHSYTVELDDWDKDVSAENNEELLVSTRIQGLHHGVSIALKLIRRITEESRFETTGLTSTEGTSGHIFGTQDMISGHPVDMAVPDVRLSRNGTVSMKCNLSS